MEIIWCKVCEYVGWSRTDLPKIFQDINSTNIIIKKRQKIVEFIIFSK